MHIDRCPSGCWAKRRLQVLGTPRNLMFLVLYALFALSVHAQTHPRMTGGLSEDIALEFLAMKAQLTGSVAQKLKRLVSKFSRVNAISVVIEEDGSYMELLCEERVRHVIAVLTRLGVQQTQITARCPPARAFEQGALGNKPSTLSIQGTLSDAQSNLEKHEMSQANVKSKANTNTNTKDGHAVQLQLSKPASQIDELTDTKHPAQSPRGLKAHSLESSSPPEALKLASHEEMLSRPKAPTKIPKGGLVHVFLQELAQSEGWTFLWYPSVSWKTIADIDLSVYDNAERAVVELVSLLRSEGKPIQLRLSTGNKVMEVLSTEVVND